MTTARHIEVALRKRYPDQAHALIFQVANGTGGNKSRTADAIAFGLWPSRGLDIEGIEIKVSRSDWLRELADPHKADTFARHCHRWWVATLPSVVEAGELPPAWGLIELKRGVMRQAVEAPRNPTPDPIPHKMWCAIMRAVQTAELSAVNAQRAAIAKEAEETARSRVARDLDRLQTAVRKFKEATGVDVLYTYNAEQIGQALQLIEDGRSHERVLRSVRALPDQLRVLAEQIEAAT